MSIKMILNSNTTWMFVNPTFGCSMHFRALALPQEMGWSKSRTPHMFMYNVPYIVCRDAYINAYINHVLALINARKRARSSPWCTPPMVPVKTLVVKLYPRETPRCMLLNVERYLSDVFVSVVGLFLALALFLFRCLFLFLLLVLLPFLYNTVQ